MNERTIDEETSSRVKQLKAWKILTKLSDRYRIAQDPYVPFHRWVLQELQQKVRPHYSYREWVTIDSQHHAWDIDRGQYVYHK